LITINVVFNFYNQNQPIGMGNFLLTCEGYVSRADESSIYVGYDDAFLWCFCMECHFYWAWVNSRILRGLTHAVFLHLRDLSHAA